MKKLALATILLGAVTLNGCAIFYDVQAETQTQEIREYGLLGFYYSQDTLAFKTGPFGLIPFMHEVRTKPYSVPPPPIADVSR